MLFNSFIFIFLFLPVTLLGFHFIGSRGRHRVALAWLVGASLFFYGWWNPAYLGLILGSMLFNYGVGIALNSRPKKVTLTLGIAVNLGLLAYFKYANFFVDNLNNLVGTDFVLESIILPLAISFFTFQQIAYLVDAYRGETQEYRFLHYALFVTFFPQLIAGPIVHHKQMLPQFSHDSLYRLRASHLAVGITIFTLGLFKKVVLADGVAIYATPVFSAAERGVELTIFEAWGGSLAYTLQLYFDFSGYSDMAIGLARMFGVRLPLNFNSPYKSTNIIDFWRRWHITLSTFLRDYLYIPLGGNRKGESRRLTNLMITMLLGGLWHGAGWTFLLWGGLHGVYLIANHLFRKAFPARRYSPLTHVLAWALTMLAVVVAWVPFRAESIGSAGRILKSMFGLNGIALPDTLLSRITAIAPGIAEKGIISAGMWRNNVFGSPIAGITWIAILSFIALALPNVPQFMNRTRPVVSSDLKSLTPTGFAWRQSRAMAILLAVIFVWSIGQLSSVSPFLYFNF
ncbi:MBOAT family protein [Marinobacter sp. MDS2]|uniref:MBOAT family O-acyltransferase n=1 Tax=Marinobacter sp. MDS2 TaxID=3065961 RepID=UPI00273CCFCD|nr:MBOAT family protein [Marinobacter sp. MDS2]MDP4547986.1 MBOAT family protein [Marinobacter sp. MDS2]